AAKSGSRVIINTSPEPFTNWTASVVEDVAVIGGLWTALHYPWLFIALMIVFILLMIWLLPKLWRGIKKVFGFIGRLFGHGETDKPERGNTLYGVDAGPDEDEIEKKIKKLNDLLQKKLITQEDYQKKKSELLEKF
ncbi:MAG: DUF4126 family protein, partial [Deltaproteobacteria bacterium]|nr:DUF4126 family protein [Deltaproteobacteria bacterium]